MFGLVIYVCTFYLVFNRLTDVSKRVLMEVLLMSDAMEAEFNSGVEECQISENMI